MQFRAIGDIYCENSTKNINDCVAKCRVFKYFGRLCLELPLGFKMLKCVYYQGGAKWLIALPSR
jgi:hypothetical protein